MDNTEDSITAEQREALRLIPKEARVISIDQEDDDSLLVNWESKLGRPIQTQILTDGTIL
jgi:hypothetical protein